MKARNYMAVAFFALLAGCADMLTDLFNVGQTDLAIRIMNRMSLEELSAHRAPGGSLLAHAAMQNNPILVRYLLARGMSTELVSSSGRTPLNFAAYDGSTEIGTILLDAGANIEATAGETRKTPLLTAAWKCRLDFVDMLIQRGANQNAIDTNGNDYRYYLKFCKAAK